MDQRLLFLAGRLEGRENQRPSVPKRRHRKAIEGGLSCRAAAQRVDQGVSGIEDKELQELDCCDAGDGRSEKPSRVHRITAEADQGRGGNLCRRQPAHFPIDHSRVRRRGESYSDVILRLAANPH
jgi:hypothetical protein